VVPKGVTERGALRREFTYFGFVDPSGGSSDSMTLAIGHMEKGRAVLDCIRERRAPFSPDDVVQDFATVLRGYGVYSVHGDRYAGEWPREAFKRRHRISYLPSLKLKWEMYRELLPKINSGEVSLLDPFNCCWYANPSSSNCLARAAFLP
jgi:hypothetical protein